MNKKAFKALQDKWYKKAKDSGFNDIEYNDGSLQSGIPDTINKRRDNPEYAESVSAYWRVCDSFLLDNTFKTETERIIWEYYTKGLTVRETAKLLDQVGISVSKSTVYNVLKRLETKMKAQYLYE